MKIYEIFFNLLIILYLAIKEVLFIAKDWNYSDLPHFNYSNLPHFIIDFISSNKF